MFLLRSCVNIFTKLAQACWSKGHSNKKCANLYHGHCTPLKCHCVKYHHLVWFILWWFSVVFGGLFADSINHNNHKNNHKGWLDFTKWYSIVKTMIVLKICTLFICCSTWFYTLVLLLWKRWHNSFVSQGDSWYPDKSNFDIKYFSPGGSKSKSDKSMWSLASPLVDKYWLLINWVGVTPNLSNFDIQYLSLRSSKLKPEKRLWPLGRPSLVNLYKIIFYS